MTANDARQRLLARIIEYAAGHGIAGRSLRQIATGAGTSHRMLLHHFGSREGLLAAIVANVEQQQRDLMASVAAGAQTPRELMTALWSEVSSDRLQPFVRLFFEIVGLAAGSADGSRQLLTGLTPPWLEDGAAAAAAVGQHTDPALLRAGVAVTRGLLLDLLAGADPQEVQRAYLAFVDRVDPS